MRVMALALMVGCAPRTLGAPWLSDDVGRLDVHQVDAVDGSRRDVGRAIDVPDVVDVPEVLDVVDVRELHDVVDVRELHDVVDVPEVLDVVDVPEVLDVVDVRELHDVVDVPEVLDVVDVPDVLVPVDGGICTEDNQCFTLPFTPYMNMAGWVRGLCLGTGATGFGRCTYTCLIGQPWCDREMTYRCVNQFCYR